MDLKYWKKTNEMRPFNSVEEFEFFEKELIQNAVPLIKKPASGKKSNVKRGIAYDGKKYDSFSEYCFMVYMEKIKFTIVSRNNKEKFLFYADEQGKQRKYYPDFYDGAKYYEVKGRYTQKDMLKRQSHPEVEWYFQEDINKMKKELDQQFGKKWRDGFIQTNVTL